jgi:hypothetical protein
VAGPFTRVIAHLQPGPRINRIQNIVTAFSMQNGGLPKIEVEVDAITAHALAELRHGLARTWHGDGAGGPEQRGFCPGSGFERAAWQRIFREALLAHVEYLERYGVPAAGARLELVPEQCPRHVEETAVQAAVERVLDAAGLAGSNGDSW